MCPAHPGDLQPGQPLLGAAVRRAGLAEMVRLGGAAGLTQTVSGAGLTAGDVPDRSAVTGYLKIGDIAGESRRTRHEDEIELIAWTFGVEASEEDTRGRRRAAEPYAGFVAPRSIASPLLWKAAATSRVLAEVTLAVVGDTGEASVDSPTVVFRNAVLTSYRALLDPESGMPWDVLSLGFEEMDYTYLRTEDDHSAGDEITRTHEFGAAR